MMLTVIVTAIVVSGHLLGAQSLSPFYGGRWGRTVVSRRESRNEAVNNLQLDSENAKRFAPSSGRGGWGGGVVSRRESTNEALDSDLHENAKRVVPFYGGRWGRTVVSRRESRNEAVNNLQLDSENAKRFAPSSGRGGWGGGVVSRRESTNEALDSDLHENAKRVAPFYGGRWGGTVVSRRESRNQAVNNLQLDSENAKRFAPSSGRGGWGGGVVSRRESTNEALDSDLHENAKRVAPFYGGRWGGTVVSRRESRNEAVNNLQLDSENAKRFAPSSGRGGWGGGVVSRRESTNEALDSDLHENAKRVVPFYGGRWGRTVVSRRESRNEAVNNLQLDSENAKRFAPSSGRGGWGGGVVSRRESTNEALDSDLHENAKRVAPFYGGRWGGTVVSRRESRNQAVNNLQLDSENAKRFAPSSGRGGWGGGVVSRRESTNEALDSDLHENAKRVAPFYGGRWGGTVVSRRESRNEAPDTDRREIAERFALDSGRAENAKRVTYDPFRPSWPRPYLLK